MSRWWESAAIYQVYPRSFADGNGDGLGDLVGIEQHLDYVERLGVDAIWLSPFYPSPQHDSGYDVADPRDVDPMYGTLADAERLIAACHARGIKFIVDVVPNHSSNERQWFLDALAAAPGSPERARYHFRDGRGVDGSQAPTNWCSIFGGPAWTRITEPDGSPGQWYLHLFDSSQPDLNWANADVRADGLETLRFWLDRGADGFRVDVALGLAKDMTYPDIEDAEGLTLALRMDLDDGSEESKARRARVANSPILDRDEVQDIYREWRAVMNEYEEREDRDIVSVAEAWVPPARAARYVARDTLHQIFNFDFMSVPFDADAIVTVVRRTMRELEQIGAPATWALSNHDTPRVVSRLQHPGIDEAVARQRARALALIAHALPGAVYVYQGEELGLADAPIPDAARQDPVFFRTKGEQLGRDAARVPLPWSGTSAPYGFTESANATWLPQPGDWAAFTVEAEQRDVHSALRQYEQMLKLRHLKRDLCTDEGFEIEQADHLVTIRRGRHFTALVNCGTEPVTVKVRHVLLVSSDETTVTDGASVMLPPATGVWIDV